MERRRGIEGFDNELDRTVGYMYSACTNLITLVSQRLRSSFLSLKILFLRLDGSIRYLGSESSRLLLLSRKTCENLRFLTNLESIKSDLFRTYI
jgi:hypothetical protein